MRLSAPRLATQLQPASVVAVAAFQAQVAARLDRASRSWPDALQRAAARELPRIALGAIALSLLLLAISVVVLVSLRDRWFGGLREPRR